MRTLVIVLVVVIFSSCVRNKSGQVGENVVPANANVFEVTEVVQANAYSYLKVNENFNEKWFAVTKADIKVGDVYYYDSALEMTNFKSKDLDRTFDLVYFVNQISKTPLQQQQQTSQMMGGMAAAHSGKVETKKESTVTLEKANNEITIEQVFSKRSDYSSKEFEIRGVVVKVNPQVMGKNWVHIQDGTSNNGNFDLTITTQDLPEVGDEVTFKGKLTLDKDFGAGYSYKEIMEDATMTKKQSAKSSI